MPKPKIDLTRSGRLRGRFFRRREGNSPEDFITSKTSLKSAVEEHGIDTILYRFKGTNQSIKPLRRYATFKDFLSVGYSIGELYSRGAFSLEEIFREYNALSVEEKKILGYNKSVVIEELLKSGASKREISKFELGEDLSEPIVEESKKALESGHKFLDEEYKNIYNNAIKLYNTLYAPDSMSTRKQSELLAHVIMLNSNMSADIRLVSSIRIILEAVSKKELSSSKRFRNACDVLKNYSRDPIVLELFRPYSEHVTQANMSQNLKVEQANNLLIVFKEFKSRLSSRKVSKERKRLYFREFIKRSGFNLESVLNLLLENPIYYTKDLKLAISFFESCLDAFGHKTVFKSLEKISNRSNLSKIFNDIDFTNMPDEEFKYFRKLVESKNLETYSESFTLRIIADVIGELPSSNGTRLDALKELFASNSLAKIKQAFSGKNELLFFTLFKSIAEKLQIQSGSRVHILRRRSFDNVVKTLFGSKFLEALYHKH